MSLYSWLKPVAADSTTHSFLPKGGEATSSANKEVSKVLQSSERRKRGKYFHYDDDVKAKIAKYACENGNKRAAEKFAQTLGHPVIESTVRNFKRAYLEKLRICKDPDAVTELPHGNRGRPLLIGDFDDEVIEYIQQLRCAGGIVNRNIVIAAAKGIISHKNPSLLKEHGGSIELGRKWAESFLHRRGFVRRKATKAARKHPPDFPQLKLAYFDRIKSEITDNDIPMDLLFNWDQTGTKLVPVSNWTMAEEGSKQVPVVGKDDKREITVLLTVTASGHLLPPQVIYQGKTDGCHARITFPDGWHVTHSESHWSTERTMLDFLDHVIIPYVAATRSKHGLADDHPALAVFDVFAAHRCSSVLKKLQDNHIHQVFVPAGCTGELQPLDVSVNEEFKSLLKESFSRWYACEVQQSLDQGIALENIKIDLKASLLKPLHANWLINSIYTLSRSNALKKAFEKTGIEFITL